ncbi:hypothetical protein BN59_03809 [Legionella massiliensis]|uniref:Uncharacterized protein n=1 Tax=Legionella massiliensis TaxID=1034943 RepID=A0A078L2T9_9GAMM|nr:hypothetical protein BN59_03809 [Legionella massiliensis]CEE15229.1 hypothetical protein BN1094_03809 [Legionella massiliensis]
MTVIWAIQITDLSNQNLTLCIAIYTAMYASLFPLASNVAHSTNPTKQDAHLDWLARCGPEVYNIRNGTPLFLSLH